LGGFGEAFVGGAQDFNFLVYSFHESFLPKVLCLSTRNPFFYNHLSRCSMMNLPFSSQHRPPAPERRDDPRYGRSSSKQQENRCTDSAEQAGAPHKKKTKKSGNHHSLQV
jgi:hypothetical protein